jgi:type IV secretory pathway VirB10-like protein
MNIWTIQIILAARGPDSENAPWIQLLVFVIIAVIAAIQGLAKTRAKKAEGIEDDENIEETLVQPKPNHKKPLQPAAQKTRTIAQPKIKPYLTIVQRIDESESVQPVRSKIEHPEESAAQALAAKSKVTTYQAASPQETFLVFDDTDKLRNAIIYYEIIGKPLAIRESAAYWES